MENIKLDSWKIGNSFDHCAEKAKEVACNKNAQAEFDFNGIKCIVSKNTNLEWLWRDYVNAHLMEWVVIGPECLPAYEPEVQKELGIRIKLRDEKRAAQEKKWREEERVQRLAFEEKTKAIEVDFSDKEDWEKGKAKNTDGYGACIYEYAEGWAKLMQIEMSNGKKLIECASETSYQLGFLGITGFMYGAAVSILSQCWKHGEDLRKWHNKEYNHEGDGVVNPAILTIVE